MKEKLQARLEQLRKERLAAIIEFQKKQAAVNQYDGAMAVLEEVLGMYSKPLTAVIDELDPAGYADHGETFHLAKANGQNAGALEQETAKGETT